MATVSKRRQEYPKGSGKFKESWVVRYVDRDKRERLKTCKNKTAADKLQRAIQSGRFWEAETDKVTVRDACERYLREIELRFRDGEFSQKTLRNKWSMVDRLIIPHIGKTLLRDLTPLRIQEWIDDLRRKRASTAGPISSAVQLLRQVVIEANRRELTTVDGFRVPPRLPRGAPKKRIVFPSKEEVRRLLKGAGEDRIGLIVKIAIFTGMRIGEIRALTWANINFDRGVIMVRQSALPDGTIKEPKTEAANRDIPMPPTLVDSIMAWRETKAIAGAPFVFPRERALRSARGKRDQCMSMEEFSNLHWRPLMKSCELYVYDALFRQGHPKFHFHALRHFAASLWIEAGLPPKQIQEWMGHTTIAMTFDRYGHWFHDDKLAREKAVEIESKFAAE